jgi:L,D-transpeptidase ErfK/SrfK
MRRTVLFCAIVLLLPSITLASGAFPLNDQPEIIIGKIRKHSIKTGETLVELARQYDVGYNDIVSANRTVDPWVPPEGTEVVIPTSWLFPEVLENGILINLPEMRLYYFFIISGRKYVKTYPIGIGREGLNTPTGVYSITLKVRDPVWKVPESVRNERPELPPVVMPGPENPLGGYWLQLSIKGYGIHGTNRPYGIGRKVSHGCIRLYPADIRELYQLIKTGTEVKIIDEPVKVGAYNGNVYIEVHRSERTEEELKTMALDALGRKRLLQTIDTKLLKDAVQRATGLPTPISLITSSASFQMP